MALAITQAALQRSRTCLFYLVVLLCLDSIRANAAETAPFSNPIPVGHGATTPRAAADFNEDGRVDLIASTTEGLAILRNTSTAPDQVTFESAADLYTANTAFPYPADLDGDGRLDVLMGGIKTIYALRNNSPPGEISSFPFAAQLMTNASAIVGAPFRIEVADLDADGKPEVLSVGSEVTVFLNKSTPGNISFESSQPSLPITTTNFFLSDLDGDGKSDLSAASFSMPYKIFLNTSTPGIIKFSETEVSLVASSVAADFTGDLKADIHSISPPGSVWNDTPRDGTFRLGKNISTPGHIGFAPAVIGTVPFAEGTALQMSPNYFSDMDGDGRTDCVVLPSSGPFIRWNNMIGIYRSRVVSFGEFLHVEFAPPVTSELPTSVPLLTLADFNSDGRPDIALVMTNLAGVGIVLNQLDSESSVELHIPARSRRILVGESIEVYGAAWPGADIARIDLFLDQQLVASTNANLLSAAVSIDAAGTRRFEIKAFDPNGELLGTHARHVLVVEQLNIQVRPRELPPQNLSTAAYILDQDDQIYGFGGNATGQLGIGRTSVSEIFPSRVLLPEGVTGWTAMASGQLFAVAIGSDGQVYTWGDNSFGQIPLPEITNSPTPLLIPALLPRSIDKVIAGARHTIALTHDGGLISWGYNASGQLGLGHIDPVSGIQSPLSGSFVWTNIFAGPYSSFALSSEGILYAWGRNDFGQLGLGHTNEVLAPAELLLPNSERAIHVAAGITHSLILTAQGNLYACGLNDSLLGLGDAATHLPTAVSSPQLVSINRNWQSVSTSGAYNLALDSEGALFAWGHIYFFPFNSPDFPTRLTNTNDVSFTQVSALNHQAIAIGTDGFAYTWEKNYGEDPSDSSALRHFPKLICSLDNICPGITNFPPRMVSNLPKLGTVLPPSGIYTFEPEVTDPDGLIDSVELFVLTPAYVSPYFDGPKTTNSILRLEEPPFTFAISNLSGSSLLLVVRDNSGGETNASSYFTFPRLHTSWLPSTNPFTGLREWTSTVSANSFSLSGAGILLTNLPPGVRVLNATSMENTFPLLQHNFPVRQYSSVAFTIELDGPVPGDFVPGAVIHNYGAGPLPSIEGPLQRIASIVKYPATVGLEFHNLPAGEYYIEYSDDLQTWFTSPVPLVAPQEGIERWSDTGPPKTSSRPPRHARFYRLRQMQP